MIAFLIIKTIFLLGLAGYQIIIIILALLALLPSYLLYPARPRWTQIWVYPRAFMTLRVAQFCICNRMRPSRIKDKFSRVFSKFSQNCPSRVLILRGLNAITCLEHRGHVETQSADGPQNKQFSTLASSLLNCCSASRTKKNLSFMHMFIFWGNYNSSSLTNPHFFRVRSIGKSGFRFRISDFGFPNKTQNPKMDFDEPKSFSKTDFN